MAESYRTPLPIGKRAERPRFEENTEGPQKSRLQVT